MDDSRLKQYTHWVAQYASRCTYTGDYAIWQYSSSGRIDGINGNVDMDICYKDFPSIIKAGGYNGYTKSGSTKPVTPTAPTAPAKKTVAELVEEVLAGKWGNGDDRKKRLTEAGYNYDEVQEAVNKKLEAQSAVYHKVVKGDTVSALAKKYKTTIKKIKELNNLADVNKIYVGQTLRIR